MCTVSSGCDSLGALTLWQPPVVAMGHSLFGTYDLAEVFAIVDDLWSGINANIFQDSPASIGGLPQTYNK